MISHPISNRSCRRLKSCGNLNELLRMFKEKLDTPVPLGEEIRDTKCSIRKVTYSLSEALED